MLTVSQFANKWNMSPSVIYSRLYKEQIPGATKNTLDGQWRIPEDANPNPTEKQRKTYENKMERLQSKIELEGDLLSNVNYLKVQKIIKSEGLISLRAGEHIRTLDEYNYYTQRKYREYYWEEEDVYFFILDVNLDYVANGSQESNRERIFHENAPIVPYDDPKVYVIHHVGQLKKVYAIIPSRDHQEMHKMFHIGSTSEEELHGAEFKRMKNKLWTHYVHLCDSAGRYESIPAKSMSRNLIFSRTKSAKE